MELASRRARFGPRHPKDDAIGKRVTGSSLITGNAVSVLRGGDEAYPAMQGPARHAIDAEDGRYRRDNCVGSGHARGTGFEQGQL